MKLSAIPLQLRSQRLLPDQQLRYLQNLLGQLQRRSLGYTHRLCDLQCRSR
jgi:hypothetical protein